MSRPCPLVFTSHSNLELFYIFNVSLIHQDLQGMGTERLISFSLYIYIHDFLIIHEMLRKKG